MTSGETEAFATRIPLEEASLVREAMDQSGFTRAELVRRAIRYYIASNPDGLRAFRTTPSEAGPLEKIGILQIEPEDTRIERTGR